MSFEINEALIETLCNVPRIERYDPNMVLVPDVLNEKTSMLFSKAFSNVTKSNPQINRVIIIAESLKLQRIDQNYILVPAISDDIYLNHNIDTDDIETLKTNEYVKSFEEVNFSDRFKSILPFIDYLFKDVKILPILNYNLKLKNFTDIIKALHLNQNDFIICATPLSSGFSKMVATNTDINHISQLLSQDYNIKSYDTPYATILNIATIISLALKLRPRFYKYLNVNLNGTHVSKVQGICSIGYFKNLLIV